MNHFFISIKALLLSILLSIAIFASEQPAGGYATFDDFKAGIISYPARSFVVQEISNDTSEYYDVNDEEVQIFFRDATSYRPWESSVDGDLSVVKKMDRYYLYNEKTELHFYPNYSWYKEVINGSSSLRKPIGSNDLFKDVSVRDANQVLEHYVIDMESGEKKRLSKRYLRSLLATIPDLLEEYDDERNRNDKVLEYLEIFLVESNL